MKLKLIDDKLARELAQYFKELKQVNDHIGDAEPYVKALADRGWFLTGAHTIGFTLEALFLAKQEQYSKVDDLFQEYYEQECGEIENRLKRIYPEIEAPLQQAFKCHREEMYFASAPLFLIQSEYIANKAVSKLVDKPVTNILFNTTKGVANIAPHIQALVESHHSWYKTDRPLIAKHQINQPSWELDVDDPYLFNRHLILHGNNISYGIKINGLKAIGFLDYVDLSIRLLKYSSKKQVST